MISGTTVTPERQAVARFTDPYLESGQSLVVNTARTPTITSVDDLTGQVVGIQVGNTSDAVARRSRPKARSPGSSTTRTPASSTRSTTSPPARSAAFIKLLPVTTWLVKDRPDLAVVQEIPTHERLAIACALDNHELCDALNDALRVRHHDGTIDRLRQRWLQ